MFNSGDNSRSIPSLLAVVCLSALAMGCGATATPTSPGLPATAQPGSTNGDTTGGGSTTGSATGEPRLHVDYTSPAGWHYNGYLPVPNWKWTFSSDVSSSPPGQAQPVANVSGDTPSSTATGLADDNPGRPNGPHLGWAVSAAYQRSGNAARPIGPVGTCSYYFSASYDNPGWPFPGSLRCDLPIDPAVGPGSGHSEDLPEGLVNSLVSELGDETPTYVINFRDNAFDQCDVFVTPPALIQKASGYADRRCGKLSLGFAS